MKTKGCKQCRRPFPANWQGPTSGRWAMCLECSEAMLDRVWPERAFPVRGEEESDMRSTTIICDRCKDVVVEGASVLEVVAGPMRKLKPEPIDLCESCSAALADWVKVRPELSLLETEVDGPSAA